MWQIIKIANFMCQPYIYKSSFLYSYQYVIYLCQMIFLCISFFLFIIMFPDIHVKTVFLYQCNYAYIKLTIFITHIIKHIFINQESLVPSILKRRGSLRTIHTLNNMAATNLFIPNAEELFRKCWSCLCSQCTPRWKPSWPLVAKSGAEQYKDTFYELVT